MNDDLRKAAQDEIADLIGWYWDIAYQEGKTGVSQGGRANYVLCQINAALRAALQSCPDCGKPAPEGSIHTCSPQKPDSWDAVIDNMMGEQP